MPGVRRVCWAITSSLRRSDFQRQVSRKVDRVGQHAQQGSDFVDIATGWPTASAQPCSGTSNRILHGIGSLSHSLRSTARGGGDDVVAVAGCTPHCGLATQASKSV